MTQDFEEDVEYLHCIVIGKVQGVGFRAFTLSTARRMGLTGWVRNRPDGRSVEVVAEGRSEDLTQLLESLKIGPSAAHVLDVQHYRKRATHSFNDFSVRR